MIFCDAEKIKKEANWLEKIKSDVHKILEDSNVVVPENIQKIGKPQLCARVAKNKPGTSKQQFLRQ